MTAQRQVSNMSSVHPKEQEDEKRPNEAQLSTETTQHPTGTTATDTSQPQPQSQPQPHQALSSVLSMASPPPLLLHSGFPAIQPMQATFCSFAPLPLYSAPQAHHLVTHNLIPSHLQQQQQQLLQNSLQGTPGHAPAFISSDLSLTAAAANPTVPISLPLQPQPLTVQDRPLVPPVYNGVNPHYPGLQVLNTNPPIFGVHNFLLPHECDFLIHAASDAWSPAPVVGRGAGEVSPSRTSSTCYLAREDLPDYVRKVSLLTGKPIQHCELPQVGRYLPTEQYLQHFDAFDLSNEDGRRFAANGGQRTVTVLVYLNDVAQGGATCFPALNLEIQPRRGMAVVFFPATVDGLLDKMALHAALPAMDPKYVSQVWIRQGEYKGQPSKRLPQTLGVPFHSPVTMNTGTTGLSMGAGANAPMAYY